MNTTLGYRLDPPEDKDEENEKCEERGDVVHGAKHDDELVPQRRKEADQLEDAKQPECAQNWEAAGAALEKLYQAGERVQTIYNHFQIAEGK